MVLLLSALLPAYGPLIAAADFGRTRTSRVGRFVVHRFFMLPGLATTCLAVSTGPALLHMVRQDGILVKVFTSARGT